MSLSDIESRLKQLEQLIQSLFSSSKTTPSGLPQVKIFRGTVSSQTSGYVHVTFPSAFLSPPQVLATQSGRGSTPQKYKVQPLMIKVPQFTAPQFKAPSFSPPTITAPVLTPPNLTKLQITPPSPPVSWGDQAEQWVDTYLGGTVGQIPLIGSYLASAVDAIFGIPAKYIFNAFQQLYYMFDLQAFLQAVQASVENKVDTDINNVISSIQSLVNTAYSDVNGIVSDTVNRANTALSSLVGDANNALSSLAGNANTALASITNDANNALANLASGVQNFVNGIVDVINVAIGLVSGLSIPTTHVRNVTTTGFDVYVASNTTVYWIAVGE